MKKLLGICLLSLVLGGCASQQEKIDITNTHTIERYGRAHTCYEVGMCLYNNAYTYEYALSPEYDTTTYILFDSKGDYLVENKEDTIKTIFFMVNYEKEARKDIKSKSSLYAVEVNCDTKKMREKSVRYFSEHFLSGESSANRVFKKSKFEDPHGPLTRVTVKLLCK